MGSVAATRGVLVTDHGYSQSRTTLVTVAPLTGFRPFRAAAPEDLRLVGGIACSLLVQPYIPDRLRAVSGVMWAGQLVAVSHQRYVRTWPPDCGGASVAETSSPDLEQEER